MGDFHKSLWAMVGKGFIATGKRVLQDQKRNWYFIDAKEQVVGRLSTEICKLLIGKHKPTFDPAVVCGDNVIVTNAKEVVLTRNQWKRKLYRWHTGYPGGLREMPAWRMKERHPERVLEKAVWGMLPKNKLRFHRFKLMRVYPEAEHKHHAQLQIAAPLPPHFKFHEKPKEGLLPKDDKLAHLREFYIVKMQQTDDAIRADGIYIPTIKEEQRKEKQIERYIRRRPTQVQDPPNFGEYVVDVHNEDVKRTHGFDEVELVHQEVAENRASGRESIPDKRRVEVDEDYFHGLIDEMQTRTQQEFEEDLKEEEGIVEEPKKE